MAAIFISNDPQKYGFSIIPDGVMEWRTVEIDKTVSLEILSQCANVELDILQKYNPELKQGTIPPIKDGMKYSFRLPMTASPKIDSLLADVEIEIIKES